MTTATWNPALAARHADQALSRILQDQPPTDFLTYSPTLTDFPTVSATTKALERKVLDELFASFKGGDWYENTADHCTWDAVSCRDDQTIRELRLYKQELSGTIPDSIGDLSSLGKWYVQFRNRESFV